MIYFLETDCLEIKTKFEFQKFRKFIKNLNHSFNIYVKLVIFATKNKHINHLIQRLNDFKFLLAGKIGTDVWSLYRQVSSLDAPVTLFNHFKSLKNKIETFQRCLVIS